MKYASFGAVIAAALLATAARADVPCGGDGPPCPPPPPGPSSLPPLPPGVTTQGTVSALLSNPIAPGQSQTIGGAAGYVAGIVSVTASSGTAALAGDGSGLATIVTSFGLDPTIIATARGFGGSMHEHGTVLADGTLIYKVTLHAANLAAANALAPLLGINGAIATVTGNVLVDAHGDAYGNAIVHTGDGIFANYYTGPGQLLYGDLQGPHNLLGVSESPCFPNGYFGPNSIVVTSGCGATTFNLPVNFVRASDYYDHGSPLDFISNISLRAAAVVIGDRTGDASTLIDPTITLAGGLNAGNYTLTVGPTAGGVPEPASWAMLIAGFGLAGTALRRQRFVAA